MALIDSANMTQQATAVRAVDPASSRQLQSHELFRGGNTVCIEHQGQQYWLRLTRSNKLILTK